MIVMATPQQHFQHFGNGNDDSQSLPPPPPALLPPPPASQPFETDISILHGQVSSLGDQSMLSAQTTQSNLEITNNSSTFYHHHHNQTQQLSPMSTIEMTSVTATTGVAKWQQQQRATPQSPLINCKSTSERRTRSSTGAGLNDTSFTTTTSENRRRQHRREGASDQYFLGDADSTIASTATTTTPTSTTNRSKSNLISGVQTTQSHPVPSSAVASPNLSMMNTNYNKTNGRENGNGAPSGTQLIFAKMSSKSSSKSTSPPPPPPPPPPAHHHHQQPPPLPSLPPPTIASAFNTLLLGYSNKQQQPTRTHRVNRSTSINCCDVGEKRSDSRSQQQKQISSTTMPTTSTHNKSNANSLRRHGKIFIYLIYRLV